MSDDAVCGYCQTAWQIICGNIKSSTPLFDWLDHCAHGGCDEDIWNYLNEKGLLNEDELPPEYVPHMPRTEPHRSHRPGPYRKEKPQKRVKKQLVTASVGGDGWVTDW